MEICLIRSSNLDRMHLFFQLSIGQRSSVNRTHVRLTKGESGHPKDTTSQLQIDIHVIFPSSCLITCRKYIITNIVDEQFANIDIEIELCKYFFEPRNMSSKY
jgi:hypothetical protein